MSQQKQLTDALLQAAKDSAATPSATTGCCTISSGGWSEQKPGITEDACKKQEAPGFTVTWKEGSC